MQWIKLTDRMPNPDEPDCIDPYGQSLPPDYRHEIDHGTAEDPVVFGSRPVEP